jgi:nitrogenase iron protein NifH
VLFSGIIANSMNQPIQKEIINDFAKQTKTTIAGYVPRSLDVTRSELRGQTVVEHAPESEQAELYRELARSILHNDKKYVPAPLESEELKIWAESWSDILLKEREHEEEVKRSSIEGKGSSIEGKRSSIEGRTPVISEA